jgi:hypothetical protein
LNLLALQMSATGRRQPSAGAARRCPAASNGPRAVAERRLRVVPSGAPGWSRSGSSMAKPLRRLARETGDIG